MSDGRDKVREGVLGAPRLSVIEGGAPLAGSPEASKNAVPAVPGRGGRGGGKGRAASGEATPESTCPLVPLGHRDGEFVFLDIKGQERRLKARALSGRGDLMALFLGDPEWLFRWFPKKKVVTSTDENGGTTTEETVIGIQVAAAAERLMAMCGEAGLFGPHVVLRGPGVWADADGGPIVHAGSRVLLGGVWRTSGFRSGDQVWVSAPPRPRPGADDGDGAALVPGVPGFAAPASVARGIQEDIKQLWKFRVPGSEIVCLGLMGIGYYGAAARWRSNGYLIGGTGSGKSLLLELLRSCVPAHTYSTDTTKSGIENAINGAPSGVFIDEAGDRADQRGAQTLLDLVLSASGNDGTRGLRGTADGHGRSFQVLCNVIMATVNPPDMGPQHRDRFTIVNLVKPGAGEDGRAAMEAAARRAREVAPRLWGRALEGWQRWQAAREAFRAALARAQCAPRELDQMGAILASWWVLTEDGVPDDRQALDGVGAVGDFIRGADEVARDDGPRRLLQFIASTTVQRDRSTDIEQIGVLVDKAFGFDPMEGDPARRLLERYGIRPVRGDDKPDNRGRPVPRAADGDGLWFARKAETLRALFRGSPFEGDRWIYEMLRHESAREWRGRNVRIGGVSGPAIWLSRADWDPPDD